MWSSLSLRLVIALVWQHLFCLCWPVLLDPSPPLVPETLRCISFFLFIVDTMYYTMYCSHGVHFFLNKLNVSSSDRVIEALSRPV